jgi:hypothetical protein
MLLGTGLLAWSYASIEDQGDASLLDETPQLASHRASTMDGPNQQISALSAGSVSAAPAQRQSNTVEKALPPAPAMASATLSKSAPQSKSPSQPAVLTPKPQPQEAEDALVQREQHLRTARTSLQQNRLGEARRALKSVLAVERGNKEALKLEQALREQETTRDELLSAARTCAEKEQWQCAWARAGEALALDRGNKEAQHMVMRAITEKEQAPTQPDEPS